MIIREYNGKKEEIEMSLGYIKICRTGNITEVTSIQRKPRAPDILKINKDIYCDIESGEIKEYKHTKTRAENKTGLRQTFMNLRRIINTNATKGDNCLWVTLTYAENMQDYKRLMIDHERFFKRLKRFLIKRGDDIPEYIACVEPQGRGAWHLHILYIWDHYAPYIDNSDMARLWGQGFTKTDRVRDADNIGAYLSVYLTDVDVEEGAEPAEGEKTIEKDGQKKRIKKGGRLKYYPSGINLYRCSKGIKKPVAEIQSNCNWEKEKASFGALTYQKIYEIVDEETGEIKNYISKTYYNKIRRKSSEH